MIFGVERLCFVTFNGAGGPPDFQIDRVGDRTNRTVGHTGVDQPLVAASAPVIEQLASAIPNPDPAGVRFGIGRKPDA